MMTFARRLALALTCGATAISLWTGLPLARADSTPPPGPLHALANTVPDVVAKGAATLLGHHTPTDQLTLTIGLGVHNSAGLDAAIALASNPASSQSSHYLTNAQYLAQYAPTVQEVQDVKAFVTGANLTVTAVAANNLLITVRGASQDVEKAFGVVVNDYRVRGQTFFAPAGPTVVPVALDIERVDGLENYYRAQTAGLTRTRRTSTRTHALRSGGYWPQDFRAAYNVNGVGDGSGQTIGLTLWYAPTSQSDLHNFAVHTSTPELVGGQAGANGIDWIPVNGSSTDTSVQDETAMDAEIAHGVAPNSHLKFFLGHTNSLGDLAAAMNDAATDPSIHVVSNSWDFGGDFSNSTIDSVLQYAVAVGTTFFFASGDSGYTPAYPTDSPYVVSVGGTSLNTNSDYSYQSESAWTGSGNGCSQTYGRPFWQVGIRVGAATCQGRAFPDVAADADLNTGAYVYYNGAPGQEGGTSLATPIWTGIMANVNRSLGSRGHALMGFIAPLIYHLANTTPRDFNDVTSGCATNCAGLGWDEVTGWSSPNAGFFGTDAGYAYTNAPTIPTTSGFTRLTNGWAYFLADYNGDGVPDLIALHDNVSEGRIDVFVTYGGGASPYHPNQINAVSSLSAPSSADLNNWQYAVADDNHDGIPDIFALHNNTGNGHHDIFVTFGATSNTYATTSIAEPTADPSYSSADMNNWQYFLADYNGDSVPDLFALHNNVAYNRQDLFVAYGGGSSPYTVNSVNAPTALPSYSASTLPATSSGLGFKSLTNDWAYFLADYNHDGVPDLISLHNNTSDGRIDIFVAYGSGSNPYGSNQQNAQSSLPYVNASDLANWHYAVGDYNQDGLPDIYGVHNNLAAGHQDVFVTYAASSNTYGTNEINAGTSLSSYSAGNVSNWQYGLADYNLDGIPDVYGLYNDGFYCRQDVFVSYAASVNTYSANNVNAGSALSCR